MTKRLKRYFIPHEENGHRPEILRFRAVAAACFLMLAAEIFSLTGPSYLLQRSKMFGVIVVNALVDGTNENRLADGLSALRVSPLLQAAAQEKANDMASKGYFAHTSPEGLTPWYWFGKVGYDFSSAGENLAVNFSDSADVTTAWMNSPEHRENILNGAFTEIGMATAQGMYQGHPATFVVELFGTPSLAAGGSGPVAKTALPAVALAKPKVAKPIQVPASAAVQNQQPATSGVQTVAAAIKGAETQTVDVPAPAKPQPVAANQMPVPVLQNNPLQNAVAAPHSLVNDLYTLMIGLFAAALVLNIFIKIRIQYPKLIFGGVVVIALAAMLIVLNHSTAQVVAVL